MAVKWTHEEIEKLILCVEQNPCLYEIKSVDYLDRVRKAQVFNGIVEELQAMNKAMNIAEVKRKWRVLRTQYMAEIRSIEKSKKSGAGSSDVYVPKLWCFQHMHFLRTHSQSRNSVDNIQVPTDEDTQSSQNIDNIQVTTDDETPSTSAKTTKRSRKSVSPGSGLRQDIEKLQTVLSKRKSEKRFAWLGNLVTSQMDLIAPEKQSDAAWEVQCLMRRLTTENPNTVPTTTGDKDILELSMEGLFEDEDFN